MTQPLCFNVVIFKGKRIIRQTVSRCVWETILRTLIGVPEVYLSSGVIQLTTQSLETRFYSRMVPVKWGSTIKFL